MARMNRTELLAEDAQDALDRVELHMARQTRLLEEIASCLPHRLGARRRRAAPPATPRLGSIHAHLPIH